MGERDPLDALEPLDDLAARDALEAEILAGMAAEVDEGEEVVTDDDVDEDDEGASSIEDLGLPMPVLPVALALELLTRGDLSIVGRLWASTNNAMLCLASLPGAGEGGAALEAACIYKPVIGERPLGDFPDATLGRREVAAFAVSRATGWDIVPPTVLRDGQLGEGMVQLWIRADPEADPIRMVVDEDPCLRPIAVFDAAVNNTDRKAGHLIPVPGGHVYGVDHGVTFSPVPKLRTVLWGWRGLPFDAQESAVLLGLRRGLDGSLGSELRGLLDPIEVAATCRRVDRLLSAGTFPQPDPRRPALPWPPV
jgi:hypothetical protein